jgi:hypothetical protein
MASPLLLVDTPGEVDDEGEGDVGASDIAAPQPDHQVHTAHTHNRSLSSLLQQGQTLCVHLWRSHSPPPPRVRIYRVRVGIACTSSLDGLVVLWRKVVSLVCCLCTTRDPYRPSSACDHILSLANSRSPLTFTPRHLLACHSLHIINTRRAPTSDLHDHHRALFS